MSETQDIKPPAKSRIKKWAPLLVLLSLAVTAYAFGLHEYVTLSAIKERRGELLAIAENSPLLSIAGFGLVYIATVALSLPFASLLSLLAGFLFGKWTGTLIVVFCATVGAAIIFLVAKSSFGETLRAKAGPLYNKIEHNIRNNMWGYLLFLRLVPLFPFFLVNIAPALFNIPLRVFVLTTFFGIMPGTFVYVNIGETLGSIDNLNDLLSTQTLFAFGLLGLFALVPTLYQSVKKKNEKEKGQQT